MSIKLWDEPLAVMEDNEAKRAHRGKHWSKNENGTTSTESRTDGACHVGTRVWKSLGSESEKLISSVMTCQLTWERPRVCKERREGGA